jgi:delta8-fatty-acid desaturase
MMLTRFQIGTVESAQPLSKATLQCRELREWLWKAGYFESDDLYYYKKHVVWALLVCLGAAISVTFEGMAWTAIGGAILGLGWQQVALVAHDAAHHGISEPATGGGMNWLGWFLGSVIFGISSTMWPEEHNMHHAITLRPYEDPQFNYMPLFLINSKELDAKRSDLFRTNRFLYGLSRILVSVQQWTIFPIAVLIGRFNLYLISIAFSLRHLFEKNLCYKSSADLFGMALYWCWVSGVVTNVGTIHEMLVFVLASHWTCGFLHIQLLLSHLAVEAFLESEERELGFFEFQCRTSRNIDCTWHWIYGGLEYQIEHHLLGCAFHKGEWRPLLLSSQRINSCFF